MNKADTHKFNQWNELKKTIQDKDFRPFFKIREIWWASIGQNIGDEQYGKNEYFERPVLIIARFYRNLALVLPISSKVKNGSYYYPLRCEKITGVVILSQSRVIDVKRLLRRVETLNIEEYNEIICKYKKLL